MTQKEIFKGYLEAHSVAHVVFMEFKLPWWCYLLPSRICKTWQNWERLYRVGNYLYIRLHEERYW